MILKQLNLFMEEVIIVNIGENVYSWDPNHYTRSSFIDDGGIDEYNFSNQGNGIFVNLEEDSEIQVFSFK